VIVGTICIGIALLMLLVVLQMWRQEVTAAHAVWPEGRVVALWIVVIVFAIFWLCGMRAFTGIRSHPYSYFGIPGWIGVLVMSAVTTLDLVVLAIRTGHIRDTSVLVSAISWPLICVACFARARRAWLLREASLKHRA
jgi:hypothetical protein